MTIADVGTAVTEYRKRVGRYQLYRAYDDGAHRYRFASDAFLREYRWVLDNARENLCPRVIRAFSDRITFRGWEGDQGAVAAATQLADDLALSRVLNLTAREALRCGDAYVLVWPDAAGVDRPWVHRADQAVAQYDAQDPTQLAWVAKLWPDPATGYGRVNVYYPDRVERWVTLGRIRFEGSDTVTWPETITAVEASFVPFTGEDGGPELRHNYGRVPWIHVPYDATAQGGLGRSVLRDVIPLQDALNKSVADLIVNSESYAAPLRALMNHKANGTTIAITPGADAVTPTERVTYDPTKSRFLTIDGAGPLVQLDPPDVTRLLAVQDKFAAKIARVCGIPAFMFSDAVGDPPSGVSLRVLAASLTAAVADFEQDMDALLGQLMEMLGVPGVTPVWEDPAPRDSSENTADLQTRHDIGVSLEDNLRMAGLSEAEAQRVAANATAATTSAGQVAVRAFNAGLDPADVLRG